MQKIIEAILTHNIQPSIKLEQVIEIEDMFQPWGGE
jgi:hypothetical protein